MYDHSAIGEPTNALVKRFAPKSKDWDEEFGSLFALIGKNALTTEQRLPVAWLEESPGSCTILRDLQRTAPEGFDIQIFRA